MQDMNRRKFFQSAAIAAAAPAFCAIVAEGQQASPTGIKVEIDADKIAIAGYSAGGLMALLAAATGDRKEFEGNGGNAGVSSKVAACVSFYAATNATPNLMPEGSDRAALDAAAPANYISPTFA